MAHMNAHRARIREDGGLDLGGRSHFLDDSREILEKRPDVVIGIRTRLAPRGVNRMIRLAA